MRAAALLLLLAGCQPSGSTSGRGIVSVNPCADALLVRLVAPERIAAISHYSHDPAATSIPLDVARRFRATAGTAEEVIALRPALVLASTFTPPATREAYEQAGLRVVYLDSPTTVAASVAQVREVATAVGERGKGDALAREIERSLYPAPRTLDPPPRRRGSRIGVAGGEAHLSIARRVATGPPPSRGWERGHVSLPKTERDPAALLYIAGDLANGSGTLLDELLTRAGFRNAATEYGLTYTGRVPLELLTAHPPAVVIAPDRHGPTEALRRRLLPRVPQAAFGRELINCGGPAIVPALARLRAIRASLS